MDTAEKFANVASERNPGVHIKFIEKKDIEKFSKKKMLEHLWQNASAIPNCHSVHYAEPSGKKHILVGELSNDEMRKKK